MSQNVTKCHKMSQYVTICHKMSQNVTKCHKMSQNVMALLSVVKDFVTAVNKPYQLA